MPLRRYHTPSRVRQTSSASIFPPLVSSITGLLPCLLPIPGPLVETGSVVERVCEAATVGEVFGLGDGDGEGDTVGEGEGSVTGVCEGVAGSMAIVGCGAAAVVRVRLLRP
jgi:hypothetical protein